MTSVRIARVERRVPPGPLPSLFPTDVVVLTDETSRRELPIWLLARDGDRLSQITRAAAGVREQASAATARTEDELTSRLLRAAGASVTGVDIDELGPGVTVARIGLASPAGTRQVTARLCDGLAAAATAGAPIRVSDAVMARLAVPAGTSRPGPLPAPTAAVLRVGSRPRYEPRNMRFARGLKGWFLDGSFTEHASESHWHDYTCSAENGIGVLSAEVPQPEGFGLLAQEMFADDYLRTEVVFRSQMRVDDSEDDASATRAGLFLRVVSGRDTRGPLTEEAALADPSNHIAAITGSPDWTWHEVTASIPADCTTVLFGFFLAGRGRIEVRDPELTRV